MKRALVATLCFWLWTAPSATASTPDLTSNQWVEQGDRYSKQDRHLEAISAYEEAIELAPGRRIELLSRIARQHLWLEESAIAVRLFDEYLESYPFDCEAQSLRALALSWNGKLKQARQAYEALAEECREMEWDALLGAARVARWLERPSEAKRIYRDIERSAPEKHKLDALLGLALVDLMQDNNRAALKTLNELWEMGYSDPGAAEARAVATLRLRSSNLARKILVDTRNRDIRGDNLDRLTEELEWRRHPVVRPQFTMFQDADGTSYQRSQIEFEQRIGEVSTSFGVGGSRLTREGPDPAIRSRTMQAGAEYRLNEWFAFRADGAFETISEMDFDPFLGQLQAVLTPSDRTRLDFAVARILVPDNFEAMLNRLTGRYYSGGLEQRFGNRDSVAISVDRTEWSAGNQRMRYRLSPMHRFEGIPQLSVHWPTVYQRYDQAFEFFLFSPREYWETGPEVQIAWRPNRHWNTGFRGRVGMQRETGHEWSALTSMQGRIEREFGRHWAFEVGAGYSNSNLASESGFRRTSVTAVLGYRF